MKKPFVSFIVMAYNAEKFIAEALDGAFTQTYDNMEIIISDDCSTDNTYAIIEEAVKAYSGKKTIRVLRNEKNLGIGAHLNKLWWEEAKGDWIVVSAGDDISLPQRTTILVENMSDDAALIHSKSFLIDECSKIIEYSDVFEKTQKVFDENNIEKTILSGICVRGATMAINKEMLNIFGPFNDDVVNEDVVLAYRSQFFGKIIHIEKELMHYRTHSKSITNKYYGFPQKKNYRNNQIKVLMNRKAVILQIFKDDSILNLSESLKTVLNDRLNKINRTLKLLENNLTVKDITNLFYWVQTIKYCKSYLKTFLK